MKRHPADQSLSAVVVSLLTVCLTGLLPCAAHAQGGLNKHGGQIFQSKCTPCHTIGNGRKVGPDLQGVTKRRPKTWLSAFISDPEQMFSRSDPTATRLLAEYAIKMPNMGLQPDDVSAVISYLETQAEGTPETRAAPSTRPVPAGPVPSGDPAEGGRYFTGGRPFQNGGPPCMACHCVPGIKYFGGGSLGPDLTTAYASLGQGLVPMLVNVPFPTMKPIFDGHPLTAAEAGHLAAFLQEAGSRQPEDRSGRLWAASLIAFVALVLVIHVLWRNRLRSVRKELVERAEREADRQ